MVRAPLRSWLLLPSWDPGAGGAAGELGGRRGGGGAGAPRVKRSLAGSSVPSSEGRSPAGSEPLSRQEPLDSGSRGALTSPLSAVPRT